MRPALREDTLPPIETWTDWAGGASCPLPDGTLFRVKFRDKDTAESIRTAPAYRWDHRNWPGDIVAYYVEAYPSSKKETVELLEEPWTPHDGSECPAHMAEEGGGKWQFITKVGKEQWDKGWRPKEYSKNPDGSSGWPGAVFLPEEKPKFNGITTCNISPGSWPKNWEHRSELNEEEHIVGYRRTKRHPDFGKPMPATEDTVVPAPPPSDKLLALREKVALNLKMRRASDEAKKVAF